MSGRKGHQQVEVSHANTTSVVLYQQKKSAQKMAAIDNVNEIIEPLNFSFCNIENIDEIKDEEPRPPFRKEKIEPSSSGKTKSKGLRLNNNSLTNLDKLQEVLKERFVHPLEIAWIDLSCNDLTEISEILLYCENLKILYLHGNQISNINEVEKLSGLKHLKTLTLHGNPLDKEKDYRSRVISYLPHVLKLDTVLISKAECKTAATLSGFNKNKRNKKKQATDDDD